MAVARQRALDLGASDRVRFFEVGARNLNASGQFDIVYWTQFFFPVRRIQLWKSQNAKIGSP